MLGTVGHSREPGAQFPCPESAQYLGNSTKLTAEGPRKGDAHVTGFAEGVLTHRGTWKPSPKIWRMCPHYLEKEVKREVQAQGTTCSKILKQERT